MSDQRLKVESFLDRVQAALVSVDRDEILRVAEALRRAGEGGRTIFVAGNGGSAATSAHLVNDLNEVPKRAGHRPLRAMDLTSNTPWLTATANDEGFEHIFASQLTNLARAGDLLFLISASGNSQNLIRAARHAKEQELGCVALLGFDGGKLLRMVDSSIWVRTGMGEYALAESIHSAICHLLPTLVH